MSSLSSLLYDGDKLLPSYSFLVTIDQFVFSFSKVSNLEAQIEYEPVQEGGNNAYPHLIPKQKAVPDTLILEKGVRTGILGLAFNMLMEGMQVELVTILLVKDGRKLEKAFCIEKGMIVKKKFSDLDAARNELLIETLEIAHSGLVEIPLL